MKARARAALALSVSLFLVVTPAHAQSNSVDVMIRNIYLGADVGVALELIPDMPAAAQFMWDQVAATDFTQRAPLLADELAREKPAVVGIQEATTWECSEGVFGSSVVVYDFLAQLLGATKATGVEYVVASKDGSAAVNPGYAIPALPFLTVVRDTETFQPIFGSDEAACGFTIADALLVRADLASSVTAVGIGDYEAKYAVVPVIFEITRGYAWADLALPEGSARYVTTHLESIWDPNAEPAGAAQARELASLTSAWTMPLVVMGDFNADPRDPRSSGAPNPGAQPDVTTGCAEQAQEPTPTNARAECNAYWTMVAAGFTDAGPDSLEPTNRTWGASALLAGPDVTRLAQSEGNAAGFTDRLDYIFVRNGVTVESVDLIGNTWPVGPDLWACSDPQQRENATTAAAQLDKQVGEALCLPTDHAGLVASLTITGSAAAEPQGDDSTQRWVVLMGSIVVLLLVAWSVRSSRRRLSK